MALPKTQLPLLSFITLFLMVVHNAHSQNEDFTSFIFDSFDPNSKDLTYQGSARVLSGSQVLSLAGIDNNGQVTTGNVGRVLYSKPIRFWERSPARQVTFETTIRFRIRPSTNGAGEGVVFFIAPVNDTIHPSSAGGNLGIFHNSNIIAPIFAVEFDTNYNGWDPTFHHCGINLGHRRSNITSRFDAGTGEIVTARINYNSNTKVISVVASSGSQSTELSYEYDLKQLLQEEVQVGISSSTGWYLLISGLPEVYAWYFTSTLVRTSVNEEEEPYIRKYVSA